MSNDNNDNIFGNVSSDKTQIFPMPGGNREDAQRQINQEQSQPPPQQTHSSPFDAPAPEAPVASQGSQGSQGSHTSFQNRSNSRNLVGAATNLLLLIAHVSNTLDARDTTVLKHQVSEEINHFDAQCKLLGIEKSSREDAKYILCTAVDEAVLNTPWGARSNWSENSLLATYFRDVTGGQVFFEKMRSLADDPARHHQVLLLMYYCLSLGYQGRYRHENDSANKLLKIRQWLAEQIRQYSNANAFADLSPHWVGIHGLGFSLKDFFPTWLIGTIATSLLAIIFATLLYLLNTGSSASVDSLQRIQLTATALDLPELEPPAPPPEPEPEPMPDIKDIEVIKNSIALTLLRIKGNNLFATGKSAVKDELKLSLIKLAKLLNKRSGGIKIVGHTDDIPLKSVRLKSRYGSNQGLSEARAKSVSKVMEEFIEDKSRLTLEGKGDTRPIISNKTADGRAMNRRVEVEITY
jgi:type VI secretion system protein ImpK